MTPGGMLILLYINSAVNILILLYIIFRKRGDKEEEIEEEVEAPKRKTAYRRRFIDTLPPEIRLSTKDYIE
jgi:hypothetical protein